MSSPHNSPFLSIRISWEFEANKKFSTATSTAACPKRSPFVYSAFRNKRDQSIYSILIRCSARHNCEKLLPTNLSNRTLASLLVVHKRIQWSFSSVITLDYHLSVLLFLSVCYCTMVGAKYTKATHSVNYPYSLSLSLII